jgi:hypothetical protein
MQREFQFTVVIRQNSKFLGRPLQSRPRPYTGDGYDIRASEKSHDFKICGEEGPSKGRLYNHPPRGNVIASISAPTRIGNQSFAHATMTKTIASCTQPIDGQGLDLGDFGARGSQPGVSEDCMTSGWSVEEGIYPGAALNP